VLLAVVNGDITTHPFDPSVGFVPFVRTATEGGSGKYIEGYFTGGIIAPGSIGGGPELWGIYAAIPGAIELRGGGQRHRQFLTNIN
jgi:hypothetical protein